MNDINIPDGFRFCVQSECPRSSECLRHLLYVNNTQDRPYITVLNPQLLSYDADGCPHFRPYQIVRYARGFCNIYSAIPEQNARKFWATVPGFSSESMYYRMKRGEKLIPPALQRCILSAAHRLGAPESIDFDDYCDVVEV